MRERSSVVEILYRIALFGFPLLMRCLNVFYMTLIPLGGIQ